MGGGERCEGGEGEVGRGGRGREGRGGRGREGERWEERRGMLVLKPSSYMPNGRCQNSFHVDIDDVM